MSPSQLSIRAADPAEVALVLEFIRELAQYERLSHEVVASETDLAQTLFGPGAFAHVLFGCLDGVPVGFAVYFFNYSTFRGRPGLYLEDLFVRPAARGRGVGRALLAHLARIATERGCARFDWAVLDWNAPAIAFYRTLGAVAVDEWTIFRLAGAPLAELARAGEAL